ncbi:hypothetical protein [Microcystis phage Mel-JY01]
MALTFFGLSNEYRLALHDEIFSLCFHGAGGFEFNSVYNMPIMLRRYYIKKIIEYKKEQNKQIEASQSNNNKRVPNFKR